MNSKDFVLNALKTESNDFLAIQQRMSDHTTIRLLHSFVGLSTEAGEAIDMLKKHIFYGKPLDKTNAIEEISDILWYIAIASDALGISIEDIMEKNIAKLKARYGEKFTETAALNRDLEKERDILEKT